MMIAAVLGCALALCAVLALCAMSNELLAGHTAVAIRDTASPPGKEVRFISGRTVYVEGILDGRWVGRYWSADGRSNIAYERFAADAFEIEIGGGALSTGWECVSASEMPRADRGARHFAVELSNTLRPIKLKVHTLVDGTPLLTRWLEITNASQGPVALTAVYPWTSMMVANSEYRGHPSLASRFGQPFTLGYFTRPDHCWEGWFDWRPLTMGATVIGCDKGQCFDDPFFIVRSEGTGQYLIGALAWSTNWRMALDYRRGDWHTLRFKIGPSATSALRVIAPGEAVRTPAVHMGLVAGDLDATVQAMHEHLRRFVLPVRKPERSCLIQFSLPGDQGYLSERFGDTSGYTEQSVLDNIDLAAALGAELFIMDAGWWDQQGDWSASPTRFPRGLEAIVGFCHNRGLLFGLYAEIEKASPGCKVAMEHPDWIEWHKPYPILDLARPEAAAYVESELVGMIERYKLDLFRLDFNTPSPTTFEGASVLRDGISENNFWRYYEAFYGIFDRIRAKYPDLILQQAACGGGRNDLGTASRFHEQYLTDGLRLPHEIQNYSGQTLCLPPEVLLIAHGADAGGGTGNAENLDTNLRVAFTLATPWLFAGTAAPSLKELNPEIRERYLHYASLYKTFIRPLLPTCKAYHHAPVSSRGGVESSGWFAMEFAAPDRTKGWATIVRIGPAESDTYVFTPRGLDRGRKYRVTFDSTGETAAVDGLRLANEGLSIRSEPIASSELLLFEAE